MSAASTTTPQPARASLGWAALRLQSDDQLALLVRDGYEQAFDAIVERYRSQLLRYSTTLVGPDRAEDVVQQAFEKALQHLRRDDRELQLQAWLYRVCHNGAINMLQRKGSNYEQLDENYDGVAQPPDVVERGQSVRQVFKQVRGLPDRQRSALMLSAVGGMSYDEIADDMSVTPPVVRQLLYRARVTLRDALGAAVPAPVIRLWLSGTPDHSHIAELVAGGGAGAGVIKAGATMMAASVVATGAGVTASQQQHDSANSTPAVSRQMSPASADAGASLGSLGLPRGGPGSSHGADRRGHSGSGGGEGSDDRRGENRGPEREEQDGRHGGPGPGDGERETEGEGGHSGPGGGEALDDGSNSGPGPSGSSGDDSLLDDGLSGSNSGPGGGDQLETEDDGGHSGPGGGP